MYTRGYDNVLVIKAANIITKFNDGVSKDDNHFRIGLACYSLTPNQTG